MIKKIISLICVALIACNMQSQTILTLEECRQLAVENYPLIKQYRLLEIAEGYTLENLSKNYLPQFGFNAQATYQSDVTKLPIDASSFPVPVDIPSMSKDQYKATLDASQLIWDGGTTSSQKKLARANSEVEKQRVNVNLYSVKESVNQLYFGILSVDEQLKIIGLTEKNLLANREVVQSMFDNGVAMQSDLDQIDVELLNLEQNRIGQKAIKNASLKVLSLFINKPLDESTVLVKPENSLPSPDRINRPELSFYNSQINMLNAQESSVTAKNMPRISLFAQGGYGRPGLNMLEDKFKLYALGGVKLTWNFGNLYTRKNEKKLIANDIGNIETQRETFLFNNSLELTKEQSEIEKAYKLLEKDDDIIRLRNRIRTASESKYRNGAYQVNELIRDINAESAAQQTKALHEIEYLSNIYKYKHIQGN